MMDTQKHTPGPWWWVEGRTLLHIETALGHPDGQGRHICSVPKRDKANADLLAVAPDMLAALEDCLAAIDFAESRADGDLWGGHHNDAMDAIAAARAAIAKARGEA